MPEPAPTNKNETTISTSTDKIGRASNVGAGSRTARAEQQQAAARSTGREELNESGTTGRRRGGSVQRRWPGERQAKFIRNFVL
jgi:hypothetical protein